MRLMCSWYRNEYSNLKLSRATMESGLGVKRPERGKSTGAVIYICMGTT
jgi:hypothetical protein